ncbi:MAG: hypothetical protein HYZ27_09375 [Deltaproteobacteria bacterium]|nr:hypothetical protein [Deltaproteobacteria bacterium]
MSRKMLRRYGAVLGVALAVAAAAGVLTARQSELVAYSERPPRFTSLDQLVPPYPEAVFYPMGDELRVDGVSREMGYATTLDSATKVADRYEAIWHSQGFKVERRVVGVEEWVTASAIEDPWMRTIVATPKNGRTVIVASVREMWQDQAPPKIPMPDTCEAMSDTGSRDRGLHTEVAFLACETHARDVIDFYDQLLAATRRRAPLQTEAGAAYLTYTTDDLHVSVAVKEMDTDPPQCAVTVTWQEMAR